MLEDTGYEDHAADLAPRILRDELGISQPRILARRGLRRELQDIAVSAGNLISDAEAYQLLTADLVVSGANQDGVPVHVLAEISRTVQQHIINRARYRARVLQLATGVITIAAVIGATPLEGPTPEDVRVLIIPTEEELHAQYRP